MGQLEKNPFDRFKEHEETIFDEEPERLRFLEENEIPRLIESCPAYLARIVKGAILTMLRKTDLLKIKWSDIDLNKGTLTYTEMKKKERKVLTKYMGQDLINLLMEIPAKSEYVFVGPKGKPIKNVDKAFKTALRKARIQNFRFHDLHHRFGSRLGMVGVDIRRIQELMGHKDIKMTMRYSDPTPEHKKNAVKVLDGVTTVFTTQANPDEHRRVVNISNY